MFNNIIYIYYIDQNRIVWFDEGIEDTLTGIKGIQHQPATLPSADKLTQVYKVYKKDTRGKAVRQYCQNSAANAISAGQSA